MSPLNAILARMTADQFGAFSAGLREISLRANDVIYTEGSRVEQIYFPSSAVLSVVTVMRDGRAVESATIGREGAAGILCALADQPVKSRVFVQVSGSALRIARPAFLEHAAADEGLMRGFLGASVEDLEQAQQSVACNALHAVSARLARWLLMTRDRIGGPILPLTQEYLAVMLGVQRTTVSAAAHELKAAGTISYSRGTIVIRDLEALRQRSCECYENELGGAQAEVG